jgi:hypothetical protein
VASIKITDQLFCIHQLLEKNQSTVRQYISYLYISEKNMVQLLLVIMHIKAKAIPLKTWAGPEGSRRLRLPDFKTIGIRRY